MESAKTLWSNAKEMQEHTMVVDLLRHDFNGVCVPGSVFVQRPFAIRTIGSLLQMQSDVWGIPQKNMSAGQILSQILPAGSVTGAPKKNVCAFIQQFESQSRGFYTGIFGVCEPAGDWETVVLIRSVYLGARGVYVGVGAGITTLSDPEQEWEEFCIKLKSFEDVFCASTGRS
jgi:anthranilate/para-aminobenzoate synthase component I